MFQCYDAVGWVTGNSVGIIFGRSKVSMSCSINSQKFTLRESRQNSTNDAHRRSREL